MDKLAICAIFKNEADYIFEWLSFNHFVGVDHFYLYNNNSTDKSLDVIRSWPLQSRVTVIDWPEVPGQIGAYRHMTQVHREAAEWCAFIDCDEFLCPQVGHNLQDLLHEVGLIATGLYVHWLMFGSSGLRETRPGTVTERFTRRAYKSFGPNRIGKSIVKLSQTSVVGFCHIIQTNGRMVNDADEEVNQNGNGAHTSASHRFIALNHYYTKSLQEWERRRSIGKADKAPDAPDFRRSNADFAQHDQNVEEDMTAFRLMQKLKPVFYPVGPSHTSLQERSVQSDEVYRLWK